MLGVLPGNRCPERLGKHELLFDELRFPTDLDICTLSDVDRTQNDSNDRQVKCYSISHYISTQSDLAMKHELDTID